jgi:hypothetical protein
MDFQACQSVTNDLFNRSLEHSDTFTLFISTFAGDPGATRASHQIMCGARRCLHRKKEAAIPTVLAI